VQAKTGDDLVDDEEGAMFAGLPQADKNDGGDASDSTRGILRD